MPLSRAELDAKIPRPAPAPAGAANPQTAAEAKALRAALAAFEAKQKEATAKLDEVRQGLLQEPIDAELCAARAAGQAPNNVVNERLLSLQPWKKEALEGLQQSASGPEMEALKKIHEAFMAARSASGPAMDQGRPRFLQELDSAAGDMLLCLQEGGEGVTFYNRLLDHLRCLKQQVSDFAFARREEKNGLLQQISLRAARGGGAGAGAGAGGGYPEASGGWGPPPASLQGNMMPTPQAFQGIWTGPPPATPGASAPPPP